MVRSVAEKEGKFKGEFFGDSSSDRGGADPPAIRAASTSESPPQKKANARVNRCDEPYTLRWDS